MSLSRHFYSLDEVHAALHYATTRNDRRETLFWCKELILSGCIGEAISTLFESWLWHKGPFHLHWLLHAGRTLASDELGEDDLLLSAYHLSRIPCAKRDHSLWNILALTAQQASPDRVTPKTPHCLPSSDNKEIYFVRALYQGKAYSAWWMSRHLPIERVWIVLEWYATHLTNHATSYHTCFQMLQSYEQLLGYRSDEYDIIIRCLAVLSLCLSPSTQTNSICSPISPIDASDQIRMQEWNHMIGRQSYRIYSIPSACLYGTTQRGRTKWSYSTINQLYDIESHLLGCPFWEDALSNHAVIDAGTIQWKSDQNMEEFYDTHFPDDIPDEWAKVEKQKSHGDGLLGPTETVSLFKYTRLFLSTISRLSWNTKKMVHSFLEHREMECHPSHIVSLFTAPSYDPLWLIPVHRIRRIQGIQGTHRV